MGMLSFIADGLEGFRRWRHEHFVVFVRNLETGRTRQMPSPRYGYYADPFIWVKDGRIWLFVEEFMFASNRGRITVLELSADLSVISKRPVAFADDASRIDCHASFPFLFEHDGAIYMLPETGQRNSINLYVCVEWPYLWKKQRRLLAANAADTMMFNHGQMWWLITSLRSSQHRVLAVYTLNDLLTSEPVPHPVNARKLFNDIATGTGRNAGMVFKGTDGHWGRLMQDSRDIYGQGSRWLKITKLSATAFEELPGGAPPALCAVPEILGGHHASQSGALVAYDKRTR